MTMSASRSAEKSRVGFSRATRFSTSSIDMRPFFAVASQFRRQVASPRSSAACSFSYTVTGMPALAKLIAMPPPIVPKPMMAARADRPRRRVFRDVRNLRRGALREERVAQRLRLGRLHELDEEPALEAEALVERLA